jgi:hypothetical protein
MTNRVVIGEFEGTYVLRVSRPGYNAMDPNLPSIGLVFDSRWATFAAIHMNGSVALGVDTSGNERVISIYHGLGFTPYVLGFETANADGHQYAGGSGAERFYMTADATHLHIRDPIGFGGTMKYCITRTRAGG